MKITTDTPSKGASVFGEGEELGMATTTSAPMSGGVKALLIGAAATTAVSLTTAGVVAYKSRLLPEEKITRLQRKAVAIAEKAAAQAEAEAKAKAEQAN